MMITLDDEEIREALKEYCAKKLLGHVFNRVVIYGHERDDAYTAEVDYVDAPKTAEQGR